MPSQTARSISVRFPDIFSLISRENPDILTIAHRGLWTAAPENSLTSIRAAAELGVEIVEIDTQVTADGKLVVIHDATLDRTTSGTGVVSASDLATIRSARLREGGGGAAAAVTGERVPTLEEALEEARGRVFVNIDTKYPRDLPLVIATVKRLGAQGQVIIKTDVEPASGKFPVLDADWFGTIPHMPMFRIRPGRFAEDLRLIEALRTPMVEVKFSDIADLDGGREELERQNIRLWINTLDVAHSRDFNDSRALTDPNRVWGVLAEAGVGAIQTDTVADFKRWLAGRPAKGASR
ncbi:glycerophosphodiester phosphodiesterase family protein [Rhizobium sp. BK602]|uniref:glycerophosphodiester phosphodiesterase family protein n=1 Tax=Rhizobium sp. BK602 TaxID=2586986 RepID=UPI00161107C0|nr:glycerophosphodiester phosphodiesterase family protein [Rhizobium sp. BK602]MBB3612564.1 glycerophosphoryl diester phosphodiesterase [Rhizobium sp. BK602]